MSRWSFWAGSLTASPSRRMRYRRETFASGISRRSVATARSCAAASRARYAFEDELATSSFRLAVVEKSVRSDVLAASGGSPSVTITVVLLTPGRAGTAMRWSRSCSIVSPPETPPGNAAAEEPAPTRQTASRASVTGRRTSCAR